MPDPQYRYRIFASKPDITFATLLSASMHEKGMKAVEICEIDGDVCKPNNLQINLEAQITHVIYVVSETSINSTWLKEALCTLSIQTYTQAGIRLLPFRIDEMAIPKALVHLHMVDFRAWKNPQKFSHIFSRLFRENKALPSLTGSDDLYWYCDNRVVITSASKIIFRVYCEISGALDCEQVAPSKSTAPVFYSTIKYAFENWEVITVLKKLNKTISPTHAQNTYSIVGKLKKAIDSTLSFASQNFSARYTYKNAENVHQFHHHLASINTLLEDMQTDTDAIAYATVPTRP